MRGVSGRLGVSVAKTDVFETNWRTLIKAQIDHSLFATAVAVIPIPIQIAMGANHYDNIQHV